MLRALPAAASACGDDVGGQRVACACGDIVVSDTTLSLTDPVVSQPCAGDGLFIVAPSGSDGIVLNLSGLTLIGKGSGAGIKIVRGGAGGATVVGGDGDARATIARFGSGIAASGRNVVKEIRNVELIANTKDGMQVKSSGMSASSIKAERNGRDGVRVSGHGSTLSGIEAQENLGSGVRLGGSATTVQAVSEDNARNGAFLTGRGHDLTNSELRGNGGAGVMASGREHDASAVSADDNARGAKVGREGALR